MVFRAIPETQQPAFWSCYLPKAAPAPQKPFVKHPFMLECMEHCSTEAEQQILEKASQGVMPPGFALKKKGVGTGAYRISARVRKHVFSSPVPSVAEEATKVILQFVTQHGNLHERAVVAPPPVVTDSKKRVTKKKPKMSPYRLSLSHRRPFRMLEIGRFVQAQSQKLGLTEKQVKQLWVAVRAGLLTGHIQCCQLQVNPEQDAIIDIEGLHRDSEGHFRVKFKRKTKQAPRVAKRGIKKPPPPPKNNNSYCAILKRVIDQNGIKIKPLDKAPGTSGLSIQDLLLRCEL